jgi:hypothetical protein
VVLDVRGTAVLAAVRLGHVFVLPSLYEMYGDWIIAKI